jgi:hypothetical protein
MGDSDDDLPPPPKPPVKPAVLDDDDDHLPVPPAPAPARKGPVVLTDSDSDGDLPPPPSATVKPPVTLDESDDDLPVPPPKSTSVGGAASPPPTTNGSAAARRDAAADDDELPGPKNVASPNTVAAPLPNPSQHADPASGRIRSRAVNPDLRRDRRQTTVRRNINDICLKDYLFKQSPTWPYGSQKRWCILKGRVLTYYETELATMPAGTLDLKGAQLVDVSKTAKMPNSFGLTGPSGQLKARIYIFSTLNREDYQKWNDTIREVISEPKMSELHWFDKMAQAIF